MAEGSSFNAMERLYEVEKLVRSYITNGKSDMAEKLLVKEKDHALKNNPTSVVLGYIEELFCFVQNQTQDYKGCAASAIKASSFYQEANAACYFECYRMSGTCFMLADMHAQKETLEHLEWSKKYSQQGLQLLRSEGDLAALKLQNKLIAKSEAEIEKAAKKTAQNQAKKLKKAAAKKAEKEEAAKKAKEEEEAAKKAKEEEEEDAAKKANEEEEAAKNANEDEEAAKKAKEEEEAARKGKRKVVDERGEKVDERRLPVEYLLNHPYFWTECEMIAYLEKLKKSLYMRPGPGFGSRRTVLNDYLSREHSFVDWHKELKKDTLYHAIWEKGDPSKVVTKDDRKLLESVGAVKVPPYDSPYTIVRYFCAALNHANEPSYASLRLKEVITPNEVVEVLTQIFPKFYTIMYEAVGICVVQSEMEESILTELEA